MRSFWLDPYLWVHLAGAAVVPIALEGCLLGFAASNSLLPPWMELLLVSAIGAVPILWMQWQRPFCIYSLMFLAVQPQKLTQDQRRILRRFKQPLGKGLSLVVAVLLLGVLWQIYQIAPIAWESAAIVPGGALGGLLLAAVSFLVSNLFLQVPVSVAQVMLTDEKTIAATEPYPVNAVARDFSLFGVRVNQILPPLRTAPVATAPAAGTAETEAAPPAETASFPADRPQAKAKTRYRDPAPVVDAEFRELGTEEWDEVIVSEEESLTETALSEIEAPAVSPEIQAETDTFISSEISSEISPGAATPTDAAEVDAAEVDAEAAEPSENSEAAPEVIAGTAETAETAEAIEQTSAEDEPIEPIPEPIEEQPELERARAIPGDEPLHTSSMTLLETEDVSEDAAVDVSAVEVVTAEIVEDVSEDAAVPPEAIASWLEDDWEEEVTG
jgi:hypothetical protein